MISRIMKGLVGDRIVIKYEVGRAITKGFEKVSEVPEIPGQARDDNELEWLMSVW
jgi:hypothetical protein